MALGRAVFGTGGPADGWRAAFDRPHEVRSATCLHQVPAVVEWAEQQARAGRWSALLVAYEAAPAFDAALTVQPHDGPVPLAWAAAYDASEPPEAVASETMSEVAHRAWRPAISEVRFAEDLQAILRAITAGDTYQVNYTFPLDQPFAAEPWPWYQAVAAHADVPFAAYLDLGDAVVMSLSPELFLERRGRRVRTRPMKGTVRRGRWPEEDRRLAEGLAASDKARAENVMIVDLLRNDLGRLAEVGSVQVRDLCRLERYPTVWQLTTTVEATMRREASLLDLLGATFPCGSVTGAPKVRTMQIIAGLEAAPRGIYTGMLALLSPGGDLVSSVPIRTAVLDRRDGRARFSVGAGITADSVAADEWAECLAKARVVRPPAVPVDAELLETLRLEDGRLLREDRHLARLAASADLFGWRFAQADARAALAGLREQHAAGVWRVRLRLSRDGVCRVEALRFVDTPGPLRVCLAARPVDPRSPLLFNKTTARAVYDDARAAAPAMDDVLLWNPRRELTETTIGNVVVELDGRRVTPPVACGLLPGVMREVLLADGAVEEAVVSVEDLARAMGLWLVNSLRGWVPLTLVGPSDAAASDGGQAADAP